MDGQTELNEDSQKVSIKVVEENSENLETNQQKHFYLTLPICQITILQKSLSLFSYTFIKFINFLMNILFVFT